MKKPVKKGSKRVKRFDEGGPTYFAPDNSKYTGDDEIVKYRMGQIKDPGVDLFKLARGESQVAKPVEFEKNKYIPNKDAAKDNKDVGEDKVDSKVDVEPVPFKRTPLITEPPISGGKTKAPVVKEIKKTTITKVEPNKNVNMTDDESSRRRQNVESYNSRPFTERLSLEAGSAYRDMKNKIKNTTAEDLASTALGMFPAFRGLKALAAGKNAFDKARDVTPKPPQIGKDVERITVDRKQIGFDPKKIAYDKPTGARNTSTSKEFKRGADDQLYPFKKGGSIKKMSSGGKVKSASARADGCAIRGKTRA